VEFVKRCHVTYCANTWKMLQGSAMRTWKGIAVFDLISYEEVVCLVACHNEVQTLFAVHLSGDNSQQNQKQC